MRRRFQVLSALLLLWGLSASGVHAQASEAEATQAGASAPRSSPHRSTRFVLGVGLHQEWRSDRGYERFGSQSVALARLTAGADVLHLARRYALSVELNTEQGGRQQGSGGLPNGEASLRTQYYGASLVPRVAALPWLWPHVRVGVGALRSTLRLRANGRTMRDEDAWGYAVDLAAGTSFVWPPKSRSRGRGPLPIAPLLRLEAGYRFASDARFGPRTLEDDDRLPTQQSSLGTLQRGAAFLRVVFALRF